MGRIAMRDYVLFFGGATFKVGEGAPTKKDIFLNKEAPTKGNFNEKIYNI